MRTWEFLMLVGLALLLSFLGGAVGQGALGGVALVVALGVVVFAGVRLFWPAPRAPRHDDVAQRRILDARRRDAEDRANVERLLGRQA